jgi:hypothetical protein
LRANEIDRKKFRTGLRRRSTRKWLGIIWDQFDTPTDQRETLQACMILREAGLSLPEEAPL